MYVYTKNIMNLLEKLRHDPIVSKAFRKTLFWMACNTSIGLLPLFIIAINLPLTLLVKSFNRPLEELSKLIAESIFVFFFIALMGTVWTDLYLEYVNGRYLPQYAVVLFLILPIIIIVLLTAAYCLILVGNRDTEEFVNNSIFQLLFANFSFIYCLIIKFANFIREGKQE